MKVINSTGKCIYCENPAKKYITLGQFKGYSKICENRECYLKSRSKSRKLTHDITGEKIGKLLVLSYTRKIINNKSRVFYLCRCDCGNIKEFPCGSLLRKEKTRSCGCLSRLKEGESSLNDLYT